MTKEEIRKEWIENRIKNIAEVKKKPKPILKEPLLGFRGQGFIDSLKNSDIDTIGVYEVSYFGWESDNPCSENEDPVYLYVQWQQKGKYFHKTIFQKCDPPCVEIPFSSIIGFYRNSFKDLKLEFIYEIITGGEWVDNYSNCYLELSGLVHPIRYFISCQLGENSHRIGFSHDEMADDENLFLTENQQTKINSWHKLIENQINEIRTSQRFYDSITVQKQLCNGDTLELILPVGWFQTDTFNYEEGYIVSYLYPDTSIVSVLCGSNAKFDFSQYDEENIFHREIKIDGKTISYERVKENKKQLFDFAFDKMEKQNN